MKDRFLSKEIALPTEVAERYFMYCEITKMNRTEALRVMVKDNLSLLHNSEKLLQIIEKTKAINLYLNKNSGRYFYQRIRLPDEVVNTINTYCKFFGLKQSRCHFMYFMVEEALLKKIGDVLDEQN